MREIITIVKGNMRKSKGVYIGIGVLICVVALCMVTIFSVIINTNTRDEEAIKEVGFGHIFSAMDFGEDKQEYINRCNELKDKINALDYVERADLIPTGFLNPVDINGKKIDNSMFAFAYESEYLEYVICDENAEIIEDLTLNKGEIIAPICFQSLYSATIGDKVTVEYDGNEYEFKIAAFFEDPYMGSSLMGIKTVLISEADLKHIAENSDNYGMGYILSVFKNDDSKLNDVEFEAKLNKDTEFSSYAWISLSRSQAYSYMTMLTNIFAGILIAFVVMLIFATLIVLSHNISNSIEQTYTNIGVLKAMGMTNRKIKYSIMIGYLFAGLCGLVVGTVLSLPVIKIVNGLMRPSIGIITKDSPQILVSLATMACVLLVLSLFINLKLRSLKYITPVNAISGGTKPVHFSSLFKLPISKKLFSISIAYRQIVTSKKQYAGSVIITAILVMFMIMISDACVWFSDDGKAFMSMFTNVEFDLQVGYMTEESYKENKEKVENIIAEYTECERFTYGSKYMLINDTQIWCAICEEPDKYRNVYEGRTCKYDNEILITEYIRDSYGIDVGDTVTVNYEGSECEFMVSGIYQCSNDAGKNVAMSLDGYKRLNPNYEENYSYVYDIKDDDKANEIIAELENTFDSEEVIASNSGVFNGIEIIRASVIGVTVVIYILAGIFSIVTVSMVCSKLFAKEKTEYGIYKAMGMTSKNIRRMFAIRFLIAAVIGCVIGTITTMLVSDIFVGSIFEMFGLYNYSTDAKLISVLIPFAFMIFVYYVVSYIIARKIKKVTPRVLVSE